MQDATLTPEPQEQAPVTPPSPVEQAPETAAVEGEAASAKQSQDEKPAQQPDAPAAKPQRERGMSAAQWRERENAFNTRLAEKETRVAELEKQLEAARNVATAPQRDEIDDLLERLGDDPSTSALKKVTERLNALEQENRQLRNVTQKSRTEYWQDHYTRVFDEVRDQFPHMDFDAYVSEFQRLSPADLAKTDAFDLAKQINAREEAAYSRRVDARKDQILQQWGFAAGSAPAAVERQAEARAEAEAGPKRDVAGKFAPKVGAAPAKKVEAVDDDRPWLKYNSDEGSSELARRILRRNGGQAN